MNLPATEPPTPIPAPARQTAALSRIAGLAHGFFGRAGGVSEGLYAGLNCGPGSGDDPACVAENRARAAATLTVRPDRLISLYQIHSADAVPVSEPWLPGEGPKADGMATAEPGLALGILTADCCPVLFADGEARVIGAAHAGWKGALGGVLETTIAAMEALGAQRACIHAALGPTISQANYEVGPDFHSRFLDTDTAHGGFFTPSDRAGYWRFDLPGFVGARLRTAGVASVDDPSLCTYADEAAYFSYRRTTHREEPDYGRNLSALALRP